MRARGLVLFGGGPRGLKERRFLPSSSPQGVQENLRCSRGIQVQYSPNCCAKSHKAWLVGLEQGFSNSALLAFGIVLFFGGRGVLNIVGCSALPGLYPPDAGPSQL